MIFLFFQRANLRVFFAMKFPSANLSIHMSHQPEFLFQKKHQHFPPILKHNPRLLRRTTKEVSFPLPPHLLSISKKNEPVLPSFQLTSIRLPFKKKTWRSIGTFKRWWGWDLPPSQDAIRGNFLKVWPKLGSPRVPTGYSHVESRCWRLHPGWGGRSPRKSPSLSHFISHGSHCYWEGRRGDFTNPKIWWFINYT